MSGKKNSRLWSRLRVLCCSGLDVMSIAPDAFAIVHELVPNAASALFLTSHEGVQEATFHEDCPASVHELCISDTTLFDGPGEINSRNMYAAAGAPKIGQLLAPPKEYFSSNTYQLLVRGCGHHHTLDARLEADGRRFGLLALFREHGLAFDATDVESMRRVVLHFEHAFRTSQLPQDELHGVVEQEALIVADADGVLLYLSPSASELMGQVPLAGPQWRNRRALPPVCKRLIDILRNSDEHPWKMPSCSIPLPGGRLEVSAHWLGASGPAPVEAAQAASESGLVGFTLKRIEPASLRVWRNLTAVPLSPQQMEVAFWMALGGGRDTVRENMSISDAVLRDCVKAIYEKLECSSQAEFMAALHTAPESARQAAA
ncbi:hypothetical protein EGT07_21135 [Herbaspirillum sp. HC18]|nr:hypothetical protein EGT07_21135 [Herbaspirillum sp. HC18]